MTSPMQSVGATDTGPVLRGKVNANFSNRFCVGVRTVADADTTQDADDELLKISATTAARVLTLLPVASARSFYVWITAADGTNTVTIDGDGAETIDGSTTKVYTGAKKLRLVNDGTSWSVWDQT